MTTCSPLLDQTAARHDDRGAVFVGTEQLHTWAELRDRALRLAASIRRTNPAGTRIAVASENRPEIVELMFAAWAAECVVVPINYKLHALEMVQITRRFQRGNGFRVAQDRRGTKLAHRYAPSRSSPTTRTRGG